MRYSLMFSLVLSCSAAFTVDAQAFGRKKNRHGDLCCQPMPQPCGCSGGYGVYGRGYAMNNSWNGSYAYDSSMGSMGYVQGQPMPLPPGVMPSQNTTNTVTNTANQTTQTTPEGKVIQTSGTTAPPATNTTTQPVPQTTTVIQNPPVMMTSYTSPYMVYSECCNNTRRSKSRLWNR